MSQEKFPIVYRSNTYYVDPAKLYTSSNKFRKLIQTYLEQQFDMKKIILKIQSGKFSDRNIENFLKLCQNLPTDCQDSEIKEICEIAKIFQADQIYNTGMNFVRSSIDPNFNVSEEEYNSYLIISEVTNNSYQYNEINNIFDKTKNNVNMIPNKKTDFEEAPVKNTSHNVIYKIKTIYSSMKLPIYQFIYNGQVEYSAKHKNDIIVVGLGQNVHLNKDRSNNVCQITMEKGGTNIVSCKEQQFKVKYVYLPGPKSFSIEAEFLNEGKLLHWKPKQPKFNNRKNSYTLSFHGEYHHIPLESSRNTVLTNDKDQMVFIARKSSSFEFEIECNPKVDLLTIFALALSQIFGPNESYSKMIKD